MKKSLFTLCIILLLATNMEGIVFSNASVPGNTRSNINLAGQVTKQENFVYYSFFNGIYKVSDDGKIKKKLTGDCGWDLNLAGSWLYYLMDAGKKSYNYTSVSKKRYICRIKTDGTSKKILLGGTIDELYIAGNSIFYSQSKDGFHSILYKMDLQGKNRRIIAQDYIYSAGFDYSAGWIYYICERGRDRFVCKVRADGTGKTRLKKADAKGLVIDKDLIYYVSKGIHGIKKDGSHDKILSKDNVAGFNISNGWIYYYNKGICRIKLDGSTKKSIILSDFAQNLNITGDWIYYSTTEIRKGSSIYPVYKKVRIDGTDNQVIERGNKKIV